MKAGFAIMQNRLFCLRNCKEWQHVMIKAVGKGVPIAASAVKQALQRIPGGILLLAGRVSSREYYHSVSPCAALFWGQR